MPFSKKHNFLERISWDRCFNACHGDVDLNYSKNPCIRTKKLRTLRQKFSVMQHLNENCLQPEY